MPIKRGLTLQSSSKKSVIPDYKCLIENESILSNTKASPSAIKPAGSKVIGGGRVLPNLLFATDPDRLRANVGAAADTAMRLIGEAGQTLLEVADGPDVWETVAQSAPGHAGVVLVGGHDVLRLRSTNALPGALRKSLGSPADADAFVVWNDDSYGDIDGDHAAEMPVTRIPDGHDRRLLLKALTAAPGRLRRKRFGLRNVKRPFAADIFSRILGAEAMLASEPTACGDGSAAGLNARNLYLVLHGDSEDCSSLCGEAGGAKDFKALSVACIPALRGGTAFLGACYGALTVNLMALDDPLGDQAVPLRPGRSIALRLLSKGALAVVGCTGTHYSPLAPTYDAIAHCHTGAPIHELFWQHILAGRAPAAALYQAKIDYLSYLPYCVGDSATAMTLKHWRQFTCLGLGW